MTIRRIKTSPKIKSSNDIQCYITGEHLHDATALRLVLSPDNKVTPDLLCKLPGKPCYIKISSQLLNQAVTNRIFDDFWEKPVIVPDNIIEMIATLLRKKCLNSLSLANRSGAVVTGFDKVYEKVLSDKAKLLLFASDAAEDSKGKLIKHAQKKRIPLIEPFNRDDISAALGKSNAVFTAITQMHWKILITSAFARYQQFTDSKQVEITSEA